MHEFFRRRSLAALAACLLCAHAATAAPPDHPIVAGFERFATVEKPDLPAAGQLLLGELNCASCHGSADSASIKQAPILDQVGSRVRVGHLKKFLDNPQAIKPGTTMPQPLVADPEREQKIEALVQFLASTGALKQEKPDAKAATSGRETWTKVGCIACHGTRDAAGNADKVLPTSIPLGELRTKYSIPSLTAFLNNPQGVRPSGRMPHILNGKEPRDVAQYLLQGSKVAIAQGPGSTKYAYFEGDWPKLPDFDTLKPLATGTGAAFDLAVAKRDTNYALKFEGIFKLDKDAEYKFTLTSDDGSRLLVDGKEVVNNDGVHPAETRSGSAHLAAGVHKVIVQFFQGGGEAELHVDIEAPGFGQKPLGELVAATEAGLDTKTVVADTKDDDTLDIKPELVAKGKQVFASAGCANCHSLTASDRKKIASTLTAPPLAKLKGVGGCLAEKPTAGVPFYSLNTLQRKALTLGVQTPASASKTPAEIIARTMTTFNCYACHQRGDVGGPEQDLNKFFLTAQPEMGDEGRVPPPLTGVGAKLNPDYLKNLLDKGAHDRPYMFTRMPGFGSANVGQLVSAFDTVDTMPKGAAVTFTEPLARVKSAARFLVGGQAFGCVKCHTFNGIQAEGVQGIDMTLMPRRLKHDWFQAYVENPPSFRPGTRMPSSFINGKSLIDNKFEGKAGPQIEAIWLYLSDGPRAQAPAGMGRQLIPLIPKDTAILYRNFIEGAGTRAIAVGYPEKAHLAFDANDLRLAMIWQGDFIDASRHWTGRGEGFQGPMGDNIVRLHPGVPFAKLETPDKAWPTTPAKTQDYHFLGYRLDDKERPTFLYSFGDVKVEDFPIAIDKDQSIRRTLKLTSQGASENIYFRAAMGTKIEALGEGWYRVDGQFKVKLTGAGAPVIRQSAGKSELLVPLKFEGGKTEIVEEFVW